MYFSKEEVASMKPSKVNPDRACWVSFEELTYDDGTTGFSVSESCDCCHGCGSVENPWLDDYPDLDCPECGGLGWFVWAEGYPKV